MIVTTYSQNMAEKVLELLKKTDTLPQQIYTSMLAKVESVSVFLKTPTEARRASTIECVPLVNQFKVSIGFREEFAENGEPLSAYGYDIFQEHEMEEAVKFALRWVHFGTVDYDFKSAMEKHEAKKEAIRRAMPSKKTCPRNFETVRRLQRIEQGVAKPGAFRDAIFQWINPHVRHPRINAQRMERLKRDGYKFVFIHQRGIWNVGIELLNSEILMLHRPFYNADILALAKYSENLIPAPVLKSIQQG